MMNPRFIPCADMPSRVMCFVMSCQSSIKAPLLPALVICMPPKVASIYNVPREL